MAPNDPKDETALDPDMDATARTAERLNAIFDKADALERRALLALIAEYRELFDDLESAEREGRLLDAAHACEELRDLCRGSGRPIAAERFALRAKAHRYESRIRTRAATRKARREGR